MANCDPTQFMIQSGAMPELNEYVTISEATAHPDVKYSAYWLRNLAAEGKVPSRKLGDEHRGLWLIHLPSLLQYIKQMDDLGTDKHNPY